MEKYDSPPVPLAADWRALLDDITAQAGTMQEFQDAAQWQRLWFEAEIRRAEQNMTDKLRAQLGRRT